MDSFFLDDRPAANKRRRVAPLALGAVFGAALLGLAISALFSKTDIERHKVVTQISLIAPPPPPPKPPEEKPPEPPKPKEEVKLEEPKPVDEPKPAPQQPPAGPLGLDAQGTGPGDAFGLAGRPGGRDITVGGGGGGGLGLSLFGTSTARHIAQELARDPKLRATQYKVEIRIWLTQDGRIQRGEIVRGTGDRDLDAQIRADLNQITAIPIPVPQNLPQPLRIRVTSSDA